MRFFAVIGFTYLITLMTANFISNSYILLAFFLLFFLLSLITEKQKKDKIFTIISFVGIVAVFVYSINYNLNIKPIKGLSEMDLTVTGKIVELPVKKESGKYQYILKVNDINYMNVPNDFKVMILASNPIEAEVYDSITCDIHTSALENTPEFPIENFYRAKGIYVQAFLYDYKPMKVEPSTGIKPFYYYALKIRQKLILIINSCFPREQSSIINGILLGNRSMLSKNTKVDFDRAGIYYLLAVSGIHISILSGIFVKLLRAININRIKIHILAAVMVFLFMSVTGFSPSVIRAGVMTIIYLLGSAFFRKSDPINSLGLAIFLLTLFNPNASIDIGLWLSFTATLGILVLTPKFEKFLKNYIAIEKQSNKILSYITDSIVFSTSASIFTFPIIAIYYKKISTVSLLYNILLIFPLSIMLFLIVVLIFLYILHLPIFIIFPIRLICGILVNYILYIIHTVSLFPFALISLDYFYIRLWTLVVVISTCIIYFLGKLKCMWKSLTLFSLAIFIILYTVYYVKMIDLTRIAVINSGEGCSLVCIKNHTNIVILDINKYTYTQKISDYLNSIDISKVDCLILSGYSDENLDFINKFIDTYSINNIIVVSVEESRPHIDNKVKVFSNDFNSNILGDSNLLIKSVNGTKSCFINVLNIKILICPDGGDAEDIPAEWCMCDVFVGGGIPSAYNKINCLYTVLSMTKNDSNIVIPKIKNDKTKLLSTAIQGTIYIDINKQGALTVERRM